MSVGSQAFLSEAMLSHAIPHPSSCQPSDIPVCPLLEAPVEHRNKQSQRTNPGQQQPLQKQSLSGSAKHSIEQQLKKLPLKGGLVIK